MYLCWWSKLPNKIPCEFRLVSVAVLLKGPETSGRLTLCFSSAALRQKIVPRSELKHLNRRCLTGGWDPDTGKLCTPAPTKTTTTRPPRNRTVTAAPEVVPLPTASDPAPPPVEVTRPTQPPVPAPRPPSTAIPVLTSASPSTPSYLTDVLSDTELLSPFVPSGSDSLIPSRLQARSAPTKLLGRYNAESI